MKILLLSDTHGHIDDAIIKHCSEADEIWHAGDFGNTEISDKLSSIKKLRGVYGNIDGHEIRKIHPEELFFEVEKLKILIIHIGGYPNRYPLKVKERITLLKPDIFICGHSHLLKVTRDVSFNNMICLNPGACGKSGFHHMRTMLRFQLISGRISDLEVIELGTKG